MPPLTRWVMPFAARSARSRVRRSMTCSVCWWTRGSCVGSSRRVRLPGSSGGGGGNHHHLVCRTCGRLDDVDCATGEAPCLVPVNDWDFVVDEAEVTYWGICPG